MNQRLMIIGQWFKGETPLGGSSLLNKTSKLLAQIFVSAVVVVMSAYVVATVVNVVMVYVLVQTLNSRGSVQLQLSADPIVIEKFNHFKFNGIVLKRHLFNSSGEYPHDDSSPKDQALLDGDCKATSLDLKLVGVIINDNPQMSVATVIDKKMKVTDVYRQGDGVIDYPAVVMGIEKGRMILDVSGARECLEISATGRVDRQAYRTSSQLKQTKSLAQKSSFDLTAAGGSGVVKLQDSYVEEQLGEGFVKIIQSSRFVPHIDESGQPQGFRVFAIKSNTLFKKIGLQDNDIIYQVNQTSLKNVEQGFALYQALQDENEVVIGVMRKGEPVTVKVQIAE